MSRPKLVEANINLSLRLRGIEAERYEEVLRRAFSRHPRADKTAVIRRLLQIDPDEDGLVSQADIDFFQGRTPVKLTAVERKRRVG